MIASAVDVTEHHKTKMYISRSLSEWRPILSNECQVYVFGENYLAKRFDAINYKFCNKNEAKEILIDNLYALLRYKYFVEPSEEGDDRITRIVASFTANLKTTLKKVSFDASSDADVVRLLPDSCIAFRNGVFDFKKNDWLFQYDILKLPNIANAIYLYDPSYIIQWYFDYDFEPLKVDVMKTPLETFIESMKKVCRTRHNYCFELMYNIAHTFDDVYDYDRFLHLCEVLGYTILQSFSQYFIMLIGSGQNGKNSLFDGCFTNRVVPRPTSNDLDSIENDRFITGALENKFHNIFLESSAKTYTESKMLKAITGSMYQTIESKGVQKYSSVINCKQIFAANDQDKVKFSDTTTGFKRRINMFEIFYQWDAGKRFLKRGDYYDTTFSDSLEEIKSDVDNTTVFIYFAMYGILSGTDNFSRNFKFTKNDWNDKYFDIDLDLKEKIMKVTLDSFIRVIRSNPMIYSDAKTWFYDDVEKKVLYASRSMKSFGVDNWDETVALFEDDELSDAFFSEHDIYLSVRALQSIIKDITPATQFSSAFRKIFKTTFHNLYANKPYIKASFSGRKLKILS